MDADKPFKPSADSPVTCCSLINSFSYEIKADSPFLIALVKATTPPVATLNAAKRLIAKADCLPNSSICVRASPICLAALVAFCVTAVVALATLLILVAVAPILPPPPPAPPPAALLNAAIALVALLAVVVI